MDFGPFSSSPLRKKFGFWISDFGFWNRDKLYIKFLTRFWMLEFLHALTRVRGFFVLVDLALLFDNSDVAKLASSSKIWYILFGIFNPHGLNTCRLLQRL